MVFIKTLARKIILPFATSLKLDKLFLLLSNKKYCIINFHGVRKFNKNVFNNRHIPAEEFEKIIKYLVKNYEVKPLAEVFYAHRNKIQVSRRTVALTFDDGYLNNFEIALPILRKYKVPATFFVVTKGLVSDRYASWPDVVNIFCQFRTRALELNGYIFQHPTFICKELNMDLLNYIKTLGDKAESTAYGLLNDNNYLNKVFESSPELIRLVSGTELRAYSNENLIEFGSHTHNHYSLAYVDPATTLNELSSSKKIIEEVTGRKVVSIAFPDGSYNESTLKTAAETGYENLLAVDYQNNGDNSIKNLLPRFTISNSTTFESNILRLAKDFNKYGF